MNRSFNFVRAHLGRKAVAIGALALAAGTRVMAEVPADVSSTISGAKTDVMAVGALVFAVAVAIVLFKWFRRAL